MNEVSELDSILLSTKKTIGILRETTEFDSDLIIAINSVLLILRQIGVGKYDFSISNEKDTWDDFLGSATDLEMVKTYVGMKVGMIFDPPQNSALAETKNKLINELEFRISVTVDPGNRR